MNNVRGENVYIPASVIDEYNNQLKEREHFMDKAYSERIKNMKHEISTFAKKYGHKRSGTLIGNASDADRYNAFNS